MVIQLSEIKSTHIFLGYDRMSSGTLSCKSYRTENLLRIAKETQVDLIDTLVHIYRKRDDSRRFRDILLKMEETGTNALFTTFLDRLAPAGWGTWPYGHPSVVDIPVVLSAFGYELEEEQRQSNERFCAKIKSLTVGPLDTPNNT